MCLTLGGGAQMCEPIVPPTEQTKKWRYILLGCAFVQGCLAMMLMWVNMWTGVYEFIDVAILCCSLAQMNYCCLTMYMVYICMNLFPYISIIGLCIQNQEFTSTFHTGNGTVTYWFTVVCLLTVYYIVAIILCFYAYREFKGLVWWDHKINLGWGCPGIG